MNKVKTRTIRGAHNLAQCSECDWDCDGITDPGEISNHCFSHVRKTGHTVTREVANVTRYSLAELDK